MSTEQSRALDAQIAERVMGWKWYGMSPAFAELAGQDHPWVGRRALREDASNGVWTVEATLDMPAHDDFSTFPRYSTDPAHMMAIADAVMQRWGAELTIGTFAENRQPKRPRYRYLATLRGGNVTYTRFDMQQGFAGDNPAALVCEAALYAAAHAVEGEADE